ncbi:uncharacterized protein LOC142345531 isoform X2 [Convolutriloba macropyga]|uniref:uncharacterized protein LOC142345531 isoform X2 n=1 Tax=Convolutriloba macropyga TaxID=536237 RepID=UPI003F51C975
MYSEERRVVVKAATNHSSADERDSSGVSYLSVLDTVMPPVRMQLFFFYGYTVSESELERALVETLARYTEFSGRLDATKTMVNLTNEGAMISYIEDASVSFEELKATNFIFDLCAEHFGETKPQLDEYLFKLRVQKLAGESGMMLAFGFRHFLADVNSGYLFVADFCAQLGSKQFKIDGTRSGRKTQICQAIRAACE